MSRTIHRANFPTLEIDRTMRVALPTCGDQGLAAGTLILLALIILSSLGVAAFFPQRWNAMSSALDKVLLQRRICRDSTGLFLRSGEEALKPVTSPFVTRDDLAAIAQYLPACFRAWVSSRAYALPWMIVPSSDWLVGSMQQLSEGVTSRLWPRCCLASRPIGP